MVASPAGPDVTPALGVHRVLPCAQVYPPALTTKVAGPPATTAPGVNRFSTGMALQVLQGSGRAPLRGAGRPMEYEYPATVALLGCLAKPGSGPSCG